jgi:hypothetical protein
MSTISKHLYNWWQEQHWECQRALFGHNVEWTH